METNFHICDICKKNHVDKKYRQQIFEKREFDGVETSSTYEPADICYPCLLSFVKDTMKTDDVFEKKLLKWVKYNKTKNNV